MAVRLSIGRILAILLRQFKQSDFPITADITFDMVTTGKAMKYVVVAVKLPQPKTTYVYIYQRLETKLFV